MVFSTVFHPNSVNLHGHSSGPLTNNHYNHHLVISAGPLIIRSSEHERITGLIQDGGTVSSGALL